ncbi:unnamed protein product [Sphagnum tenellum]
MQKSLLALLSLLGLALSYGAEAEVGGQLYASISHSEESTQYCQAKPGDISCQNVKIDFDVITSGGPIGILHISANMTRTLTSEEDQHFKYEDEEGNLIEVFLSNTTNGTDESTTLTATITTPTQLFDLEPCGPDCHVLIEQ